MYFYGYLTFPNEDVWAEMEDTDPITFPPE